MSEFLPSLLFSMFDFAYNKRKGGREGGREKKYLYEWAMDHPSVHTRQWLWIKDNDSENKDQETSFKS